MKEILLPPLGPFLIGAVTVVIAVLRGHRRWLHLALACFGVGYISALPVTVHYGLLSLEIAPPLSPTALAALLEQPGPPEAVVILSAGLQRHQGAIKQGAVDELSLERLQLGARMARAAELPILVSGGCKADREKQAIADHMAEALRRDFRISARWRERRSCNTFENAQYSAALLRASGIEHIALVTHAWHLRRAMWSFEQMGIHAIPVGTGSTGSYRFILTDLLPNAHSFRAAYYVFHEWIGLVWYRLRYG